MKKFISTLILFGFTFVQLQACEDCIEMIYVCIQKADEEYENYVNETSKHTKEEIAWAIGVREHTKRGLKMAAQLMTARHEDMKLTMEQWEALRADVQKGKETKSPS